MFACPPEVSLVSGEDLVRIRRGHELVLTCNITGSPLPAVRWMVNDSLVPGDDDMISVTQTAQSPDTMVSTLSAVNTSVSGVFSCVAINSAGVDMVSAQVLVTGHITPAITWEMWFVSILLFLVLFSTFVGVICSVTCRCGR